MKTTEHGSKRVRKRIGIKKKAVDDMRDAAFNKGLTHAQAKGQLNRYFTKLFFQYKTCDNARIYANYVWIFSGETLITVFPVPNNLRKQALAASRRCS